MNYENTGNFYKLEKDVLENSALGFFKKLQPVTIIIQETVWTFISVYPWGAGSNWIVHLCTVVRELVIYLFRSSSE